MRQPALKMHLATQPQWNECAFRRLQNAYNIPSKIMKLATRSTRRTGCSKRPVIKTIFGPRRRNKVPFIQLKGSFCRGGRLHPPVAGGLRNGTVGPQPIQKFVWLGHNAYGSTKKCHKYSMFLACKIKMFAILVVSNQTAFNEQQIALEEPLTCTSC